MAEAKADKSVEAVRAANAEAQKRANETMLKEDIEKAMDAEEAASRAKAKAAAVAGQPSGIVIQFPKLISRTGGSPLSRAEEAFTAWSVAFGNCPDAETALNSPALLWQIHAKLKRFDTILMHDEFYAWEVLTRVMKIDKDLQVVLVSPIGVITKHSISNKPIDYDQIKIINRGAIGKWSWIVDPDTTRARVLKDGFETEELAAHELKKKRVA